MRTLLNLLLGFLAFLIAGVVFELMGIKGADALLISVIIGIVVFLLDLPRRFGD